MFDDCNLRYFDNSLPRPMFGFTDEKKCYARFCYYGTLGGIYRIEFSRAHKFDRELFKTCMIHEMIHFYLRYNHIKDDAPHGTKFMQMVDKLNKTYNLKIF
jgi:hypothetical protein